MRTIYLFTILFTFSLFHLSTLSAQPLSSNYLLLGPFPVAEDVEKPTNDQERAGFDKDLITPDQLTDLKEGLSLFHKGELFQWQTAEAAEGFVDLDAFYESPDYVYAYGYAEIEMPEAGSRLVGVGSDDGIRIWLNGKLVHDNFVLRPHLANEDMVVFDFQKGKNTILVRVQDSALDWGFSLNFIEEDQFTQLLGETAMNGHMDKAQLLLDHGAEPNGVTRFGLTPWQIAKVKGRTEIANFLVTKGADPEIPFPPKEELVEKLFEELTVDMRPGASVLVARGGEVLYENGFGYANIEKEIPVTPETKFRIGSISKQFTSAAILKLVEKGALSLDDKLSKFIPDFPRGDEVTIRHLLTHVSGIHSFTSDAKFMDRVTEPIEWDELLEEIKKYEYDFDPGTSWAYNNSGYFILGYLVEQLSGMSFNDYLKKTFFAPLGMKNTGVYDNSKPPKKEALGYEYDADSTTLAMNWDMSWAGGAGNLYSTVGDLYLWNEGIFDGKVLSAEMRKAAHTPVLLNNGELPPALGLGGYGYGWVINKFRDVQEISHGGGLHGFVTNLSRLSDQNLTVVVLTNTLPSVVKSPDAYTHDLIEIYTWDKLGEQESFSTQKEINADLFDDYVGHYEYPTGAIMVITRKGDKLFAKLAYQPANEIFPQTDSKFFWKVVDAQVEFVRDENGVVTHGMHTQGGQTFKVPRIEPEVVNENVDPAIYERFTGEYTLGPAVLTVTTDGEHLYVEVTGQPTFELFPKSDMEYFMKEVKIIITFEEDEEGNITQLTLLQAGISQTAIKK